MQDTGMQTGSKRGRKTEQAVHLEFFFISFVFALFCRFFVLSSWPLLLTIFILSFLTTVTPYPFSSIISSSTNFRRSFLLTTSFSVFHCHGHNRLFHGFHLSISPFSSPIPPFPPFLFIDILTPVALFCQRFFFCLFLPQSLFS